jgi:NAD(P)-dependent dehydrogenase (short-subunit alcohol dehydrogenase family)
MTELISTPADFSPAADCLKGRVILVTGASGSIGRVAAATFAKHGATVILHGRSQTKLDALYDDIETAGGMQPAIIKLDYLKATEADYKGLAETVFATFKQLDGIFHAASHMEPLTPLALQNLTSWQAHTTVNLHAPVALTRACLPMLKRAANGRVVFLSETHAHNPTAYWGAFATSKAALGNVATIWNAEMDNESPLRFCLLVPGPILSQMRAMSHPGEHASELPPTQAIASACLYLQAGLHTEIDIANNVFQASL